MTGRPLAFLISLWVFCFGCCWKQDSRLDGVDLIHQGSGCRLGYWLNRLLKKRLEGQVCLGVYSCWLSFGCWWTWCPSKAVLICLGQDGTGNYAWARMSLCAWKTELASFVFGNTGVFPTRAPGASGEVSETRPMGSLFSLPLAKVEQRTRGLLYHRKAEDVK